MTVLTEPVWNGWALDRHTAEEISAHLHRAQPRIIVESGSGWSTVLLAEYASRTGATVISLEHHERWAGRTRADLKLRELDEWVDVRLCPLTGGTVPAPWYETDLPGGIDFALVDGPPGESIGRAGALPALYPHLNHGAAWQVWLDDASRPGEQAALDVWREFYDIATDHIPTRKGLTRIFPADVKHIRTPLDATDVAITLLTGGRADLLSETILAALLLCPGLLETAHVAVLHNGAANDPATTEVLDTYADVIDLVTALPERLSVGEAAAALLCTPAPRPYVLHLEDDWQAATADTGWLDVARTALAADADLGQVRLRHRGDKVLGHHMLTRRPIVWTPAATPEGGVTEELLIGRAHYTLNPSLMRAADTPRVWPAAGEQAAAKNFYHQNWLAGQVVPGVFRHAGDGASLRLGER